MSLENIIVSLIKADSAQTYVNQNSHEPSEVLRNHCREKYELTEENVREVGSNSLHVWVGCNT